LTTNEYTTEPLNAQPSQTASGFDFLESQTAEPINHQRLEWTLGAVRVHRWVCVLLGRHKKFPVTSPWQITNDPDAIRAHVLGGNNIGLLAGPWGEGVAVLDFDSEKLMLEMFKVLGHVSPWAQGRADRFHCYFKWEPDLPSTLTWRGQRAGEIIRGPAKRGEATLRQAVMPPSVHPDTLKRYRWLTNPGQPVPPLPDGWRRFLEKTEAPKALTFEPKKNKTSGAEGDLMSWGRNYLKKAGPAVEGHGGDYHTFLVSSRLLNKIGLSQQDALTLLEEWDSGNCPPWGREGLKEKLRNAARYGRAA
jgi:hypothetical protein